MQELELPQGFLIRTFLNLRRGLLAVTLHGSTRGKLELPMDGIHHAPLVDGEVQFSERNGTIPKPAADALIHEESRVPEHTARQIDIMALDREVCTRGISFAK